MYLPWFGQVGDARVRAHQHVGRVQRALEESSLALAQMDPAERSFGQEVRLNEREAVYPHLVYRVDGLQDAGHPLE